MVFCQGKHLKNEPNIKNYNESIKVFNNILKEASNPHIIFGNRYKNYRTVKFIYEINYKSIRRLILLYQKYEDPHPKYIDLRSDYHSNIRKLN